MLSPHSPMQCWGMQMCSAYLHNMATVDKFSKNHQEEENTITFRLKCIVIA